MKIGILSRNENLYSTKRLVQVGEERGHTMVVIDPLRCYMDIGTGRPRVHYREQVLDDFDAIIPRIGASITYYGTAVLRQFEMMDVYTLNESVAIGRSRDKLRSLQILSCKNLGLPLTSFAHSTKMTHELIRLVGGPPLVIKLLEGSQGKGVVLAETMKAAESVIDAFREMQTQFLVQEFIQESRGRDLRCFVIGDQVVASMMRQAKQGEFRSNLHRGGKAEEVELTLEEKNTAIMAAKAMGLNVAGVDILQSRHGPLVLEVNSSPGLQGIEVATSKNVTEMMITFIERNYLSKRKLSNPEAFG